MVITLNLTFNKASGKKHTVKIAGAKAVQDPAKVKALMNHIVTNNILYVKGDPIVSAAEAKVQNVSQTEVVL